MSGAGNTMNRWGKRRRIAHCAVVAQRWWRGFEVEGWKVGWGLVFSRGNSVGRIRSGHEAVGGGDDEVGVGDSGFTRAIFADTGS